MPIGQSAPMLDAYQRVTGSVRYALNVELPGLLFGRVLRSPHPHARVVRINTARAAELPGVVAVTTRDDLLGDNQLDPYYGQVVRDQPILAVDRARYAGEPVAAVAATDTEIADRAVDLIEVEYEPLPAVCDIDAAMAPDAPRVLEDGNVVHHFDMQLGDVDRGFRNSDVVFEDEYRCGSIQPVPLEPHVCVARFQGDRLTVWASTQTPYFVRAELAAIFKLPLTNVRVIVHTLGGGYGSKAWTKTEPLTALLAGKAGQPVKLVLGRSEDFLLSRRSPALIRLKTGVLRDGTLVAQEVTCYYEKGAYTETGPRVARGGGVSATGAYRIPNRRIVGYSVFTNLPPSGPVRAPGVVQTVWAGESHLDAIAQRLAIDPVELRRKNLAHDGEPFIGGGRLRGLHFGELLEEAAGAMQPGASRPAGGSAAVGESGPASGSPTVRRGRGVALTLKTVRTPTTGTATCLLNEDGSLSVACGAVEMGQGVMTTMAQIAADALALPLDQVSISELDTDVTPHDDGTTGSRTTYAMGTAIRIAAGDVRRQLLELAAGQLEVSADDLILEHGSIRVNGVPGQGLPYAEVVRKARRGNLLGQGTFISPSQVDEATFKPGGSADRHGPTGTPPSSGPAGGQPGASVHWHQGAASAEIEVDTETGKVRLLRCHSGVLAGRIINPRQCELQLEGSMAFGLGQSLLEELVFDNGQMTNPNLADYMVPSFLDMPPEATLHLMETRGAEEIHGVGESTLPPVIAAISNAVADAIGHPIRELPITPERVLQALQRRDTDRQGEGAKGGFTAQTGQRVPSATR